LGDTTVQADKKQILNRLATIEGHLRGIRKMVDEDVYCVDILKQSYAVERAIKAFESAQLEGPTEPACQCRQMLRRSIPSDGCRMRWHWQRCRTALP
jgi:DNA-binding FrmR family transcriptional regulator